MNVNILLILIGMFMESISAILILAAVLMPVAIAFGVDPLHFGLIIILNLSIGMVLRLWNYSFCSKLDSRKINCRCIKKIINTINFDVHSIIFSNIFSTDIFIFTFNNIGL